jgi:hypothetical protein
MERFVGGMALAAAAWGADPRWEGGTVKLRESPTAKTWSVELAKLPIRLVDCENEEQCYRGENCHGLCARYPKLAGADSARRLLYFTVDTGSARNHPMILFTFNFATGGIQRLTKAEGSWVDSVSGSPDGRYLAFVTNWHTGLGCPGVSWASVVDLKTRRSAPIGGWFPAGRGQGKAVDVMQVRWLSSTRLSVEATIQDDACAEDRETRG